MIKENKKAKIVFIFAIVEGIILCILILGIIGFFLYNIMEKNKFLGVWEYYELNENNQEKTKVQLKIERENKILIYIANYDGKNWVYGEEREGVYHLKDSWMSIELYDDKEDVHYIWMNFAVKKDSICYSYDCKEKFDKTDLKNIEKEMIVESSNNTSSLNNLKEIKSVEIEKLSKEEPIVVLIARESCSWCLKFEPIYEEVMKDYNLVPYYIDIAKILDFSSTNFKVDDLESYNSIVSLKGKGKWETFASDEFGATPQVLIVQNNQVIGGQSGYTDASSFSKTLENAGIKKD